ncbi:HET-domain-containing protein [Epithele typhae]|uniref:HET-domain-containing protein n=1 Tax=Epithele typhae TaxID=378194 RepID=UPI00200840DF|nr:HET-domain-containing protein [Epithele typhae]KAH9941248.1 HET-domain-containing protein [Epithele typhae]
MWLLSTDRAELRFFNGPLDVSEGFAILSHRWDDHEQTFEDVQALRLQCKADGTNPRKLVCTKIRESCKLAEKHGHKWLWIDTCCIDKRSSVELSEAVNSMFRYYSLSNICYAYLRDVPARSDEGWELKFKQSVWHDRAWTLQELIAPKLLLFVSSKWTSLGTKAEHAELINSITTVPAEVLCLEQDISEISIYDRMVWAAARRATKVEDEAYSLMGIFGINMPILYGEGQHAFYRLQEEIMKTSTDTSLFAWGGWNNFRTPTASRSPSPQAESAGPDYCSIHEDSGHYLLAPSPIVFNARRPGIRFHVRITFTFSAERTVKLTLFCSGWLRYWQHVD